MFRFILPTTAQARAAVATAAILAVLAATPSHAVEKDAASTEAAGVPVTVAKASNACFSDMVRVTGFIVPRQQALVSVDREGGKVTEILVHSGDLVTENQELIRLTAPTATGKSTAFSLRAPVAGMITKINTIVGAPASPQGGPMVQIAVDNEIELDAEVPGIHALKLKPGATARISRDGVPDLAGRVRLVSPEIDRKTQLGHVRLSLTRTPALKVGMFARATIDASRSCGVAIPRSAVDHLTVQVVKGNTVETRKVRVGLVSDTSIEILDGVKQGELVVADAGTSLHDGDQVKTMFADEFDRSRGR
ncbi:hemolysin D [Rhodopseudomonas palustris]|uniref:Hemolysin D n=1 Tax=Rhodopseudomonas palustris TaxID=1076 RepID=A0A0D7EI11_RHOPL|nr:hemolysin D [Rhodopseudomonas palustris]